MKKKKRTQPKVFMHTPLNVVFFCFLLFVYFRCFGFKCLDILVLKLNSSTWTDGKHTNTNRCNEVYTLNSQNFTTDLWLDATNINCLRNSSGSFSSLFCVRRLKCPVKGYALMGIHNFSLEKYVSIAFVSEEMYPFSRKIKILSYGCTKLLLLHRLFRRFQDLCN